MRPYGYSFSQEQLETTLSRLDKATQSLREVELVLEQLRSWMQEANNWEAEHMIKDIDLLLEDLRTHRLHVGFQQLSSSLSQWIRSREEIASLAFESHSRRQIIDAEQQASHYSLQPVESVKLSNILKNIRQLALPSMTAIIGTAAASSNVWAILSAITPLIISIFSASRIKISQLEAHIVLTMWGGSDPDLRISENDLRRLLNRDRSEANLQLRALTRDQVRRALMHLEEIHCVKRVEDDPARWEVIEVVFPPASNE